MNPTKINALFISDVHLGTSKANADKLLEVFKNYEFDKLVILGDLIDLTSLKRKFYWKQNHFTVVQKILRMSRKGVEVVYILGKAYNFFRGILGFEKWSLSAFLKTKVKNVVSFLNDFKYMALERLKEKGGDAIMIGHTHTPAVESMDGKNYYNTGDFCETCSYMVETCDGKIELRYA